MAPNIYSITIAVFFFLRRKMCVSSHAPSRKQYIKLGSHITPEFWALCTEFASWHLSGV